MPGALDPLYVVARSVLLDALDALDTQRAAVVLVGAQAIYLHTGAADLAVAEFTTDADITLDPSLLKRTPEIEAAMTEGGFRRANRIGAWFVIRLIGGVEARVEVDLMVPDSVGGPGSRAARLTGHAKDVARKTRGMEAALVDKRTERVSALDTRDTRSFEIAVAGPAALMVSKLHKIRERLAERDRRRVDAKDGLDVLRLLRAVPTRDLANSFSSLLNADMSGEVTREALAGLKGLFTKPRGVGSQMAVEAAGPLANGDEIASSCAILAADLLMAIPGMGA